MCAQKLVCSPCFISLSAHHASSHQDSFHYYKRKMGVKFVFQNWKPYVGEKWKRAKSWDEWGGRGKEPTFIWLLLFMPKILSDRLFSPPPTFTFEIYVWKVNIKIVTMQWFWKGEQTENFVFHTLQRNITRLAVIKRNSTKIQEKLKCGWGSGREPSDFFATFTHIFN